MAIGRWMASLGKNHTSVRIGILGQPGPLIQIEDASVDSPVTRSNPGAGFVVTKGVITGGSIPLAFGTEFDEIIFCKNHEKRTP